MKLFFTAALVLIALFVAQASIPASEQIASSVIDADESFQAGWNVFLRDPKQTPLKPDELAYFRGISWFPIQASYRVRARFVRTPSSKTFYMPTSSGVPKVYVKFGTLTFTLNHHLCRLAAYQSQTLAHDHPDKSVFVPFTDKTSGKQSYGGGRYLDFTAFQSNFVSLDFNKAYNPYCAYTTGYSCPIPPVENRLPIAILAGAKAYSHFQHQQAKEPH